MKEARPPMSPGEKLFRSKCRACHILPKPSKKSPEEWPKFLPAHVVNKKISDDEVEEIVRFLQGGGR